MLRYSRARWLLAALLAAVQGAHAQQTPTTPRFRSGVDAIAVDVAVVDDRGRPIQDLLATDFAVKIDGRIRRVASAEWVAASSSAGSTSAVAAPLPEGYQSNEQAAAGRLVVLAIDQPNIPIAAMRTVQSTLPAFVDRLSAADRVAVIGFGPGAPSIPFTNDRERIKRAITQMRGQQSRSVGSHSLGLATSFALERSGNANETDSCDPQCSDRRLNTLVARDCPEPVPGRPGERLNCKAEILAEARTTVQNVLRERDLTLRALETLLTALKGVDAQKTVILISQRLVLDTERESTDRIRTLGALAGQSRTALYAIRLDDDADFSDARQSLAPQEDARMARQGLDTLTVSARGAVFNVAGTGAGIFERIASELSGYYLLGVEPEAGDRDGKAHDIDVTVTRRGATVRAPRSVLDPSAVAAASRSPREAALAALDTPLTTSAIPLRAVAFAFRSPDLSSLQLVVHAEIGSGYTAPAVMAIGYVVRAPDGRGVDSKFMEARLSPRPGGVPSPLMYDGGVNVPPGEYIVKLAVADPDRVGSIELPARAALTAAGSRELSALIVGAPVPPGDLVHPSINPQVSYGLLHPYVEVYGDGQGPLKARFNVLGGDGDAVLLTTEAAGRPAGAGRELLTTFMSVDSLPPGPYRLQAVLTDADAPLTTLTRRFEIGREVDAPAAASPTSTGRLVLPVDTKDLAPSFALQEALDEPTLKPFRDRVASPARLAFDEGLKHLQGRRYQEAEASLRRALRDDGSSIGTLGYLGVCFAASGHDVEAGRVWKTAMALDDGVPQLYAWLGESFMRTGAFAEARTTFERAIAKWPSDTRFARPRSLLHATFGEGRDAVRTMEQFLGEHPNDPRSLHLVIEWIVTAHRAGAVVYDKADDVRRAREYSARYLATNPPNAPLVRQWVEYLEKEAR